MKHGDKIIIMITIEAEIETPLDNVTADQLTELLLENDVMPVSSIFDLINDDDTHETGVLFDTVAVSIKPKKGKTITQGIQPLAAQYTGSLKHVYEDGKL